MKVEKGKKLIVSLSGGDQISGLVHEIDSAGFTLRTDSGFYYYVSQQTLSQGSCSIYSLSEDSLLEQTQNL